MSDSIHLSANRLLRLRLEAERQQQEADLREEIDHIKRIADRNPQKWNRVEQLLARAVLKFMIAHLEYGNIPVLITDPDEPDFLLPDGLE